MKTGRDLVDKLRAFGWREATRKNVDSRTVVFLRRGNKGLQIVEDVPFDDESFNRIVCDHED